MVKRVQAGWELGDSFIESFPQMYFEGKWLQNRLRVDKNESISLLVVDTQGHQRGVFCIVLAWIYCHITGIMCDRKVPAAVKGKMFHAMIRPGMMYKMGTVAVTKGQEPKMELAEIKMMRFSPGKTRLNRIEITKIGRRLGVKWGE